MVVTLDDGVLDDGSSDTVVVMRLADVSETIDV